MKPTISNFEPKKRANFVVLPPTGAYVAEIQAARAIEKNGKEVLEIMVDITEGEFKGRYHQDYEQQREYRGDKAQYRGKYTLYPYDENAEPWQRKNWDSDIWCIQQSNEGYAWDWDESKLKGKKIGISVRKELYTSQDGEDKEVYKICQLETVSDVKEGKCKPIKDRDKRKKDSDSTDGSDFTDVSKTVDVPW